MPHHCEAGDTLITLAPSQEFLHNPHLASTKYNSSDLYCQEVLHCILCGVWFLSLRSCPCCGIHQWFILFYWWVTSLAYYSWPTHSPMDEHLGYFLYLAIISKACLNILVKVFLGQCVFISHRQIFRFRTIGSQSWYIFILWEWQLSSLIISSIKLECLVH